MQPSKPKPMSRTARPPVPLNKGAFAGPKPPLKPKQIWSIRLNLQRERRIRDPALFRFELTEQTRDSLIASLPHRGGGLQDFVFPSRTDADDHIGTRQYARLVGEWVEGIGLGRSAYATHSLRRTNVALIYKRTGNLRAVQILLGKTKLESTVPYLGVDAEDAQTLSEGTEI